MLLMEDSRHVGPEKRGCLYWRWASIGELNVYDNVIIFYKESLIKNLYIKIRLTLKIRWYIYKLVLKHLYRAFRDNYSYYAVMTFSL